MGLFSQQEVTRQPRRLITRCNLGNSLRRKKRYCNNVIRKIITCAKHTYEGDREAKNLPSEPVSLTTGSLFKVKSGKCLHELAKSLRVFLALPNYSLDGELGSANCMYTNATFATLPERVMRSRPLASG